MPKSRKSKYRRLEHKYRSFVFRSLVAFLLLACLFFFLGIAFSTDGNQAGVVNSTSPFLYLGFLWTGMIFLQISVKFVIGTIRAQSEKRYKSLLAQLGFAIGFIAAGLVTAFYGVSNFFA